MHITPFKAPLGARIEGLDLALPISEALSSELRELIHKHQVVLFPQQSFTAAEQLNLAKTLGPVRSRKLPDSYFSPKSSDDTPGIAYVSNIRDSNGIPTGIIPDGEMWFHHDTCYTEEPDKFTMLYAIEVPKHGGNTRWANMYAAWNTLPSHLKKEIEDKRGLNVYDYATIERPDLKSLEKIEHAWQPAVITHPHTNHRALFVNRLMTCQIEGLDETESFSLLEPIFDHIEQDQFIYEHTWRPGDFIIWDNLSTVHARTHFELSDKRRLRRCKVSGETLM